MTKEEKVKMFAIMIQADGGCGDCIKRMLMFYGELFETSRAECVELLKSAKLYVTRYNEKIDEMDTWLEMNVSDDEEEDMVSEMRIQ